MVKGDPVSFSGLTGTVVDIMSDTKGSPCFKVNLEDNQYNIPFLYFRYKDNSTELEVLSNEEIMRLTNIPDRMPK